MSEIYNKYGLELTPEALKVERDQAATHSLLFKELHDVCSELAAWCTTMTRPTRTPRQRKTAWNICPPPPLSCASLVRGIGLFARVLQDNEVAA